MNILNLFKKKIEQKITPGVSFTSRKEILDAIAGTMRFVKRWECGCGAGITIKADKERGTGSSNFEGVHTAETIKKYGLEKRMIGHSIVQSGLLNWNGLLEERGWQSNPVICPACLNGMSLSDFKAAVREGRIKR